MGWEAVQEYHLRKLDAPCCQNQVLTTVKKEDVKIIDDKVKEISKDTLYPRRIGDYISDH